MKKIIISLVFVIALSGCYSTIKYGWLPGGDYEYYEPLTPVNLQGERYRLEITDNREGFNISCSTMVLDRNTELEGPTGFDFFRSYARAMLEANKGVFDPNADNVLKIELKGLSAEIVGYGYGRVYGLIEFRAYYNDLHKNYCSVLADGDEGAPVGKFSVTTRKSALRKMASATTRRALEELMKDLVKVKEKQGTKM